ncbi:hypothetical protein LCGC14_2548190 [marine sediment metagenome]|uniref:Uncharacterized protein n=1 Tax=marine sediment metagenome TaxID=412755 RepID=A0A0F9BBK7_9ZZZZ
MTVQLETNIKRFRGLSTDVKPGHDRDQIGDALQTPPVGSVFTETETGRRFIWRGSWPWVRQEQTIEAILERLIEVNSRILATLVATQRGHVQYSWGNEVEPE